VIRAVIFDMDGVLCDSEPFIAEAGCRMFRERYGLRATPADFKPFVGTGEDRFLGGVAERYGVTLRMPGDKDLTYAIYLELIKRRLKPLPGAHAFVGDCRSRGLRLAVATSADRVKLEGNLAEIGIPASRFDATVTGTEVARKKPHPDLFLAAATRLGVPPSECLVVEDAPSGVRAATAAGMVCLALATTFPAAELRAAGADWTAPDLAHPPPDLPFAPRT
jgi:HAD superfamily hydrolase (TIGR01509 family)